MEVEEGKAEETYQRTGAINLIESGYTAFTSNIIIIVRPHPPQPTPEHQQHRRAGHMYSVWTTDIFIRFD